MPELTPEQIRDVREKLQETVRELNRLLDEKGNELSDEEADEINKAVDESLNASARLSAQAIQGTAEQVRESVQGIRDATNNANMALRRLKQVGKVIQIVTALVGLGTAIAAGNPGGIITAANGVIRAVNHAESG